MKMDEHARAWSHEFVSSVLGNAGLAPEQRSSLHWEILSHLHEKAERRVEGRSGAYITLPDIQAVVTEMGGREGVAAVFLQTRISSSPRAGFAKRFFAYVIDVIILFVALGVFWATVGWLFIFPFGLGWGFSPFPGLIWFGLALAYFVLLEVRYGQTIGKMALNLRTVMMDGKPVTTEAAIIRNIAKVVPFLLLIDVILYLVSFKQDDQRASDRIAKTIVIDTTKGNWSAPAPPPVPAPQPPPPQPTTTSEASSPPQFRPDEPSR
jgi:uncharacterized RDD family membrane protein YckC